MRNLQTWTMGSLLVVAGMALVVVGCGGTDSEEETGGACTFAGLDGDGDGVITEAELSASGACGTFGAVDSDGDGVITETELADSSGATEGAETATEGAEAATEGAEAATEGAETATEGAEAQTEGAEAQTEGAESQTEGAETATDKEDCIDGIDNDEDGLVDCADPECTSKPACAEGDCTNGADDDQDGLVDCEDPDCEYTLDCNPESCNTYYLCLAELGCDCEMGKDCPETGTDEFYNCQSTCSQNQTCADQCVGDLSQDYQLKLSAFQDCIQTFCANVQTDEEWSDCLTTECIIEYGDCFYTGAESCAYYYFECAPACQTQECSSKCAESLSSQGFQDAVSWDDCRFELCNTDGDDTFDSSACALLGNFLACGEKGAGCIPEEIATGAGTCQSVTDCVLACENLGDDVCMSPCLEQAGGDNISSLADLWTCVITTCGTFEDELTPACVSDALANGCAAEWSGCGGGGPDLCADVTCEGGFECDSATGECVESTPDLCADVTCDDGFQCESATGECAEITVDPCDALECDDGDACNGVETCEEGACVSGPAVDCDGDETCVDGECVSDTPDPCDGVAGTTHEVSIVNFEFEEADLSITTCDSVTWTNNGTAPHTASADDDSFDSGTLAAGTGTFTHKFTAAGTVAYHCNIHPSMTASIAVTD